MSMLAMYLRKLPGLLLVLIGLWIHLLLSDGKDLRQGLGT
jgi:hypothetical protein